MALTAEKKATIVQTFQRFAGDTGSPEVQIALLTEAITSLKPHFDGNPKDRHSKRGLSLMVERRRKLLAYLKRESIERYRAVVKQLGLRR